jgi:hypothetical protein
MGKSAITNPSSGWEVAATPDGAWWLHKIESRGKSRIPSEEVGSDSAERGKLALRSEHPARTSTVGSIYESAMVNVQFRG